MATILANENLAKYLHTRGTFTGVYVMQQVKQNEHLMLFHNIKNSHGEIGAERAWLFYNESFQDLEPVQKGAVVLFSAKSFETKSKEARYKLGYPKYSKVVQDVGNHQLAIDFDEPVQQVKEEDSEYAIALSDSLSKPNDPRYVIISLRNGIVVDDCGKKGYRLVKPLKPLNEIPF